MPSPSPSKMEKKKDVPQKMILTDFYGNKFRKEYATLAENPATVEYLKRKKAQKKYALLSDNELRKLFFPFGIETMQSFGFINRVADFSEEEYNKLPKYCENIFKDPAIERLGKFFKPK